MIMCKNDPITCNLGHMPSSVRVVVIFLIYSLFGVFPAVAQFDQALPEAVIESAELERDLRFLASDELRGRAIGSQEIDIAARYLAERFRALDLDEPPGAPGYYQPVPLVRTSPPASGLLVIGGDTLRNESEFVALSDLPVDLAGDAVFAGFGIVDDEQQMDDYDGLDVEDKIVIAAFGAPDSYSGPYAGFMPRIRTEKAKLAAERGARAFVEVMRPDANPGWQRYSAFLSRSSVQLALDGSPIPIFVAVDNDGRYTGHPAGRSLKLSVNSPGMTVERIHGRNVAAVIPGTDPELKNEYVILVAHYDHVGVGRPVNADSIYNGARDNGMGTVALLAAGESLGETPARRSVLLLAVTAEEVGLLGSRYYADRPLVPPEKTIFVLNMDGAGYTDTSIVTVIGLERTGAEAHIRSAASAFDLEVLSDPVPEQNLFNRSDNVPFARLGIPAPTVSPGFHAFDAALMKYYHRPADEINATFDFSYLYRYSATVARAARLIANDPRAPAWAEGDPYESAAKKLYGR